MMKVNLRKVLVAIIVAIILIAQTGAVNAATTIWVGVRALRDDPDRVRPGADDKLPSNQGGEEKIVGDSDGYGYSLEGNRLVWKLLDYGSGEEAAATPNWKTAIYCLDQGKGFTAPDGTDSLTVTNIQNVRVKYDGSKVMEIKQSGLAGVGKLDNLGDVSLLGSINDANTYNSVLWILDHCYLPKSDIRESLRTKLLSDMLAFFEANKNNEQIIDDDIYIKMQGYQLSDFVITDNDIEAIQQAAIWRFTNFSTDSNWEGLPTVNLINGDGSKVTALANLKLTTGEGEYRNYEARLLYAYLITEAAKTTALYAEEREAEPKLTMANTDVDITKTATSSLIGPFRYTINENGKTITGIEAVVKIVNSENSTLTETTAYKVLEKDKTTETTIDKVKGEEFYIKIDDTSIADLEITVKAKYYKPTVTHWEVNGDDSQQPLAIIDPTEGEVPVTNRLVGKFDLSLRKYITGVTKEVSPTEVETTIQTRTPEIDTSKLNTTGADDKEITTATYNHKKDPVVVETGNIVNYKITIYNEGSIDGKATEIIDQLPTGLEFVKVTAGNYTAYEIENNQVKFILNSGTENIPHWTGSGDLSSETIEFECKVTGTGSTVQKVLTNVAWISNHSGGTDRDSTTDNHPNLSDSEMPTYKGDSNNKSDLSDKDYFYKGQEDDDDFEKLIIKGAEFDLALTKFISSINGVAVSPSREPVVNYSKLNTTDTETTATYTHSKAPVKVKPGDIVTYTIRVYNEGLVDGYAEEISDYIPEGLGYLMYHNTNKDNMWSVSSTDFEKLDKVVTDLSNVKLSDYDSNEVTKPSDIEVLLGKAKITTKKLASDKTDTLIPAFNKDGNPALSYKDVQVTCVVLDKATSATLRNVAEISIAKDKDKNVITDRDSVVNNVDVDKFNPAENEDDDDYEDLTLGSFDLALRKFITAVRDLDTEETITSRIPSVTYKDGKLVYTHPKTPVVVANGNIVTYTIRVYNEGNVAGYAKEIKDNVPAGLEYLPDNAINKQYGWVLNSDGTVSTEYLTATPKAKEGEAIIDVLNPWTKLEPFDPSKPISDTDPKNPDYRDVKIAFKVVEDQMTKVDGKAPTGDNRVIINTAEIKEHTDENGNPIYDDDSTPNNNIPTEDDLDKEYIKVKYFDLSLLKYVSKVIVTENGKTTERDTGYNGTEKPEPVVKVDLGRKTINSVTVKFVYTIKVTNEGEIAGYAKEIKDYIPNGLKFVQEDNPDWKVVEEQKIYSSSKLENTLLQPGQSATVNITLTWINGESNMGLKVNEAEISKDYNEYNSRDVDSTPDNKKTGEDDIDEAHVMLAIKTGGEGVIYFTISGITLIALAAGVVLIKKFVL